MALRDSSKDAAENTTRRSTGELGAPSKRRMAAEEEGYILIAVLFLVVMVLIALSLAAPKVAADIERDREVELMNRGKQYRRAIQLYYKKFGAYPPNMDALEKTSEIRFLRKRYKDPVTGKDEWHLIHFGENKLPTAYGFFGQPLNGPGGSTLAGTGPGGVGQNIGSPAGGSSFGSSSFGGSSFGGNSGSGSSFSGSSNGFGGQSGSSGSFGSSGSSSFSGSSGISGTSPTGTDPNSNGSTTTPATGTDPNSNPGSTSSNSAGSSTFGSGSTGGNSSSGSGQTFGGGGIIGVESTSSKQAILEYHKAKHLNEWEFVYDPQQDRMQISGNTGTVGQPISGAGNSTSGTPTSPSLLNGNPTGPVTPATPPTNANPAAPQP